MKGKVVWQQSVSNILLVSTGTGVVLINCFLSQLDLSAPSFCALLFCFFNLFFFNIDSKVQILKTCGVSERGCDSFFNSSLYGVGVGRSKKVTHVLILSNPDWSFFPFLTVLPFSGSNPLEGLVFCCLIFP